MKKTSTLLIIGFIVALLTGTYTGYAFWQKSSVTADSKAIEKQLSDLEGQKLKLENQEVLEAINAKRALNSFDEEIIHWSHVIARIRATVPVVKKSSLVDILSYSGSGTGPLSINVKTLPGSGDPYFDVADLIEAFSESEEFVETFVPSISSGVNDEGNEILTFVISTIFVNVTDEDISEKVDEFASERELESDLSEEISDVLSDALDQSEEEVEEEASITR